LLEDITKDRVGWSVEDGLVPALQGLISIRLLGGADLSWLVESSSRARSIWHSAGAS
jgi:hypothetical protein